MRLLVVALVAIGAAPVRADANVYELDPAVACVAEQAELTARTERLDKVRAFDADALLERQFAEHKKSYNDFRAMIIKANKGVSENQRKPVPDALTDEQLRALPEFVRDRESLLADIETATAYRKKHEPLVEQARIAAETCEAEVLARGQARESAASTASLDDLREIPPDNRLPEEQARIDEDIAAHEELVTTRLNDKKAMRPVYSALICDMKDIRASAKAAIAEEKKYAREVGGYVDSGKIYALQEEMRAADVRTEVFTLLLKQLKGKAAGCSDKTVKLIRNCAPWYFGSVDDAPSPKCEDQKILDYLELVDRVTALLRQIEEAQ
jgi:hypothetical protein